LEKTYLRHSQVRAAVARGGVDRPGTLSRGIA